MTGARAISILGSIAQAPVSRPASTPAVEGNGKPFGILPDLGLPLETTWEKSRANKHRSGCNRQRAAQVASADVRSSFS
jgi:hypothetical protein